MKQRWIITLPGSIRNKSFWHILKWWYIISDNSYAFETDTRLNRNRTLFLLRVIFSNTFPFKSYLTEHFVTCYFKLLRNCKGNRQMHCSKWHVILSVYFVEFWLKRYRDYSPFSMWYMYNVLVTDKPYKIKIFLFKLPGPPKRRWGQRYVLLIFGFVFLFLKPYSCKIPTKSG